MLVPIMIQGIWYEVKWHKRIFITLLLTVAGTIGTYIMFFIENGWIGGTSFFGAVLFVPILFLPVFKLLRIPYGILMDLCAPAECAMLIVMKIQCVLNGCCGGRQISFMGNEMIFPSQIAELITAFLILIFLMAMAKNKNNREIIYPMYMLVYGVLRFILNIFREDWIKTEMFIPFGNIWSLVAIIVGITWIAALKKFGKSRNYNK